LNTRTKSTCCGDSFYPQLPARNVNELMKKRTAEMPLEDVIVYCVSCIQSVSIGGKKPRYLPDLLFGLDTLPKVYPTEVWHRELDEYIEKHWEIYNLFIYNLQFTPICLFSFYQGCIMEGFKKQTFEKFSQSPE